MPAKKTTDPRTAGKSKRKTTDWEAVERDYRTSGFTLRELAAKHGATHTTISRRAERQGWTKDLTAAIRQATNAKLIEASVQQAVQQECNGAHQRTTDAVLGAAELNKQVILAHRGRVGQATEIAMRMLAELDATTTKAGEIKTMFEVLTEDMDEKGKAAAQQQLREFMRLHSRVGSVHKLMDALGKAQTLERQAFGLDEASKTPEKPAPLDWSSIPEDERMAAYLRMVSGG